jgi:hypothetical protein
MQLFGSDMFFERYHSAASWWLPNFSTTCSTATSRHALPDPGKLAFFVMYTTTSPACNRGANRLPRHKHVISGIGCSKSGSRRIEPSMKGGRRCFSLASLPARVATSGLKVLIYRDAMPPILAAEAITRGYLTTAQRIML